MYLYGDAPLPREYGFMALSELRREPPDDAGERVLVAVDCANETRMAPDPSCWTARRCRSTSTTITTTRASAR